MKKFACFIALACVLVSSAIAFAGGISAGTRMTDSNLIVSDQIGLDTNKTISATLTGTKPAFSDQTVVSGTDRLMINCVTPSTGAAAAGRLKINNAGTEIPLNGMSGPYVIPKTATTLAFGKYSTGTVTDSVKCTAFGH